MRIILSQLATLMLLANAGAAQTALNEQARQQVLGTVRALCGQISDQGFSKELVLKGDINAELEGLARRLMDLGIEGAAEFNTQEYSGVLHNELGGELRNIRECNLEVWDDLKSILLSLRPVEVPREIAQYNRACSKSGELSCQGKECEYIEFRFAPVSTSAQSGLSSGGWKYAHQRISFNMVDIERSNYKERDIDWGTGSWTTRDVYMRCSVGECIRIENLDNDEVRLASFLNIRVADRSCGTLLANFVSEQSKAF